VYLRVATRRDSTNAIHSGTAVRASERLWIVSASSATDPENATTAVCSTVVASMSTRLIFSARIPSEWASIASSIESAAA
jgi:hypothetical protein